MIAYERVIGALRAQGCTVSERRNGSARSECPGHGGTNESTLSIRAIEGQVLIHCFAGCEIEDVASVLDLTLADLYDEPSGARYDYTDAAGTVLRSVLRSPDKKFTQRGQTKGTSTLYRLPEVIAAVAAEKTVFIVEGEKDVHALEAVGTVATTAPMGSANWNKVDATPLHDADVIVIVDRDQAGQKWAGQVRASLDGKARSLTFKQAHVGKDAADHIAAGHGLDELEELVLDEPVAARRARITWASQIEPEPVVWAWQEGENGRIPAGSLSVAAGRESTGKSSFGVWLAAQITRGTLPGSYFGEARSVFYVAVEESWKHALVPRLLAAGADLDRVGRFDVISHDGDEITLSLPLDNHLLEREMKEYKIALVVIDPLMSVIGERIDTHREREVRSALDPLAKMADRTGSVLLGIAHFNKGGSTDAASLITGSGAFKNVPRSVFGFARDETDENGGRVMSQVKNSLGRDDLPSLSYLIETAEIATKKGIATIGKFTFTGESDRSVAEILRDSRGEAEGHDERRELDSWLVDYLSTEGGSANARDVIRDGRATGFTEDAIKKARRRIRARSERQGFGKGSSVVWTIDAPIGAIDATNEKPAPMAPMPAPMQAVPDNPRRCPDCQTEVPPGHVRCGLCFQLYSRRSA